jgi:outer membrane protein
MKIIRIALATAALVSSAKTEADPRKLTLAEAVQMALRTDPLISEAHVGDERARLGVLRAQLDRMQIKADGSITELWNKSSIGLPTQYNCTATVPGYGSVTLPVSGASACNAAGFNAAGIMLPANIPTKLGGAVPDSLWEGLSNFQIQGQYFLFSGFRVEANVKRAKLNQQAALVQVKQNRKDVALNVARAYWNVRRALILRDVQKTALARMEDAESIADARVKAGLAPPIDKNRATQRKLTQMSTLEDLQGQANAALAQLGVTLGTNEQLELVDDPEVPPSPPTSPTDLVAEAWKQRPEVKNARLQTEIQHQQVRMARSNFFPQITLLGNFQYGNNVFNIASNTRTVGPSANPFAGLSGAFYGGAQLSMNFFDTLNTYTATGDAWYQEQYLKQEERRWERLVDNDVKQAYANLNKLYARRTPLVTARAVAEDNLSIIEGRYKNGDALIIEYLDAQIDLANAELNLADVNAQMQQQWLELQAALGFIVGVDHG